MVSGLVVKRKKSVSIPDCGRNKRWQIQRASQVVVASRLNGGMVARVRGSQGRKKMTGKVLVGRTWPRRGVVPSGSDWSNSRARREVREAGKKAQKRGAIEKKKGTVKAVVAK